MRRNRKHAAEPTGFDPTTVPVFPVLTVEIIEDRELLVDGRVETVPLDTSSTDAAVAAAAGAVRRRGLDHCRVSAIVNGTTYPLVVGADGTRYDVSAPLRQRSKSGRARTTAGGRAWVVPVAVMIFAVVAAGVVVATVNQFRSNAQPTSATAAPAPSPTELPVLPPDGWSTHATWAVPVASINRSAVLAHEGSVFAVTGNGTLTAHDASTGAATSQARFDGALKAGPLLTTIDKQTVVAVATSRYLYWWPDPRNLADVRRVSLIPRAEVSFAGASPLVTLPGQHAAAIVGGALSDRTIPAGAQAVRADNGSVLALDATGHLWRLDQAQPHVPEPQATLQPPRKGQVPTLLGSTALHLAVSWRDASGSAGSLSIVNLQGETVASRGVPTVKNGSDWTSGPATAVAAGHVFTFQSPQIVPVTDPSWRNLRIVNETIYGTAGGRNSAVLDAKSGKVRLQANAAAVIPLAADSDHAYVGADTPDGPVLYALERN